MGKELHVSKTSTGTVRVRETSSGDIVIDSYFGDVRSKADHDRFTLNATTGQISGHGYNHQDKFDTSKNSKTK